MSEWKTYKLGDLIECIIDNRGKSAPISISNYQPIIEINALGQREVNYDVIRKYVSKETYDTWFRAGHPKIGDILFSTVGTIGLTSLMTQDVGCIAQNIIALRVNDKLLNNLYLYYFLNNKTTKINLNNLNIGGVQPSIKLPHLLNMPISLPPLAEQKRIADILSAIDDKIELNRRINANLEQQAQALYKSWFVDNKKDDWEEKRLDDIISIYDSQRKPLSGQQREKMEKLYPYYGAASLMDYVDNYLFDGIYILLGEDGTVSDSEGFPMLQYVWGKFWVNNHAHILQGKNGFTTESLYILLKQTNVSSIVTGAVQPKISQANLKSVPITMPPINLLNQYNNIIKPIFNQIRINHNQIQQLSTLRDTLLPKLMSGEIKV